MSDVKGFKIGEKRPQKKDDGVGPGKYNPEKAEAFTKPQAP